MSRAKLVEEVKRAGGAMASPGVAAQAVDAVFAGMARLVEDGEPVQIRGFGTFAVKDRAGRKGRNPRTGEPVQIQPRKVLTFSDRRPR
jgi:nucleoid DNA-binding protein